MTATLAGTHTHIKLILRLNRVALGVWVGLAVLFVVAGALSFAQLYPSDAEKQAYVAEVASNPSVIGLIGAIYAPTLGGLVAWRWTIQGIVVAALGGILIVIQRTRGDEETGRAELLGAGVAGRHAPHVAALIVVFGANLVMALLVAAALAALGLPPYGAFVLGASVGSAGCVFAALAGVTAQVFEYSGTARATALGALGLGALLRSIGDTSGPAWLSWLSPFAWARATRPFAGEQPSVFMVFAGVTAALVVLAMALRTRRDLGAGLVQAAPGPSYAAPGMGSPLGLAWRLQRGMLFTWTLCLLAVGMGFGVVTNAVVNLITVNPAAMGYLKTLAAGSRLGDAVFHIYFLTFGPLIAPLALLAAGKLRAEESQMRADPVLATPVSRTHWALSHVLFVWLGPAVALAVLGATAGLIYGLGAGDVPYTLPRVLGAALLYLPPIWLLGGMAIAQFGWLPRLGALPWLAWLVFGLFDFLSTELRLISDAFGAFSPFAYVPRVLLNQPIAWPPLVLMIMLATVLTALGLAGLRRRDLGS